MGTLDLLPTTARNICPSPSLLCKISRHSWEGGTWLSTGIGPELLWIFLIIYQKEVWIKKFEKHLMHSLEGVCLCGGNLGPWQWAPRWAWRHKASSGLPAIPSLRAIPPKRSLVKNPPANADDTGDQGSIPGLGRFPGGGNGNPLQYPYLENPMDRGAWRVCGVTKSQTLLSDWEHTQAHQPFLLAFPSRNPNLKFRLRQICLPSWLCSPFSFGTVTISWFKSWENSTSDYSKILCTIQLKKFNITYLTESHYFSYLSEYSLPSKALKTC